MSIYLGNNKVTGAGIQLDNTLDAYSNNAVTNAAITAGLSEVGYNAWVKPADWVDIRSGALENSIYLLVAHSLPTESGGVYTVATYPQFHVTCRTSTNTNTYDVFVDGIKVATTAWDVKTVLDWATLYGAGTVSTIYTTTHPSELVYHIVRIAPTVSTDTLTKFSSFPDTEHAQQGILWAHYQLSNPIRIAQAFGGDRPRNYLLEAVTAKNNKITYTVANTETVSGFYAAFAECTALMQIPVLEAENMTYKSGTYVAFRNVPAKKVVIKNNHGGETFAALNYTKVEEFEVENGLVFSSNTAAKNSATHPEKLKRLPAISANSGDSLLMAFASNLQDTFVNDSANTGRKYLRIYGTSSQQVPGLKGLLVSNQAPFDGASPQIQLDYTGLNRAALLALFKSMPYNVGYTVTGSPTITDGVASGFSENDYLRITSGFSISSNTKLEIGFRLINAVASSKSSDILRCAGTGVVLRFYVTSAGKVGGSYKDSGGNTRYISYSNVHLNEYFKFTREGNDIKLLVSSDNQNWDTLVDIDNGLLNMTITSVTFGGGENTATYGPLDGSIDLNNTYININGIPWFRGTAAMTKTCSIVGCTGTADLTADDKAICTGKGWELTVE